MVLGANTFREFVEMLGPSTEESGSGDPWVTRMRSMPTTVVSIDARRSARLAGRDRRER